MVADALAANPPPGDLGHRAEVAQERTTASRVDSEHGNDVTAEVAAAGRNECRRLEILLPAAVAAVDRLQFAAGRVAQDFGPDQLRLRLGEAHAAPVQHRRVAGHHVRAADDRQAPVAARVCRQVQRAMELVALHAHQRQQRVAARGPAKQGKIPQVGVDVFVDRMDFDGACRPRRPASCSA